MIALVFVLLLGILAGCSEGDTTSSTTPKNEESSTTAAVIKIGSVNSDKHTLYKGYEKFQEIVQEKTDGRIKVEIYPNGQLGDDRTMIEGLQFGTLEAVGVSTSMLANWAPPMLAFDLPFAFPEQNVAYQVLDGPYGKKAGKMLEKEGLVLLAYMENGYRHLTNNKKEVKTVEDVADLKIRTMQTPLHLATWEALEAKPTPMAYTELFTAMQQGVIDGQENPYGNMALDKFYEVQKYMTVTNHVYNPMGLVISKKFLDGLSQEDKQIIKEAAVTAGNFQRELNQKENEKFKQILVDNGMKITELTPEAYEGFKNKVQSVYEDFSNEIGKEHMDEFLAEVEKHSK
ncbi:MULTISPECIES: TRAP transporter substrate-binding protein [Metabacillus]|uniref:TRAP transporter substrate-binding protein n=2 Tax=Metabacillus TaxID=2675233 RepID=A0A179T9E0_9BACI|nr:MULTISPECIES: TRAP transporter substrate-binding protein [Metabacillus]OAS89043.1 hypothetical protein A6K24_00285 [Metabacillus litoralis]QNF28563.1 TRAP transporter substrate-binding protein [Metabacillus sp. KUDC1714]